MTAHMTSFKAYLLTENAKTILIYKSKHKATCVDILLPMWNFCEDKKIPHVSTMSKYILVQSIKVSNIYFDILFIL